METLTREERSLLSTYRLYPFTMGLTSRSFGDVRDWQGLKMEVPLNPYDAAWVGVGTAVGVIATAVFGWMRVRSAGLTRITLKEMKQRDEFLTMVLVRLRELERMNAELQRQVLEVRNDEEAKVLERRINNY